MSVCVCLSLPHQQNAPSEGKDEKKNMYFCENSLFQFEVSSIPNNNICVTKHKDLLHVTFNIEYEESLMSSQRIKWVAIRE